MIGALSIASSWIVRDDCLPVEKTAGEPLRPNRRDGPGAGYPVQRSPVQPARRRGTHLPHGLAANYRFTLNKETVAKKYPLNYYFLSQPLAAQGMTDDNTNHKISEVMSGQTEQSEVEVKNVTITAMSEETVQNVTLAKGTALINLDKLYSSRTSQAPRTEHWMLSVTYYINPAQVNQQSQRFPPVRDDQSARSHHHRVP